MSRDELLWKLLRSLDYAESLNVAATLLANLPLATWPEFLRELGPSHEDDLRTLLNRRHAEYQRELAEARCGQQPTV